MSSCDSSHLRNWADPLESNVNSDLICGFSEQLTASSGFVATCLSSTHFCIAPQCGQFLTSETAARWGCWWRWRPCRWRGRHGWSRAPGGQGPAGGWPDAPGWRPSAGAPSPCGTGRRPWPARPFRNSAGRAPCGAWCQTRPRPPPPPPTPAPGPAGENARSSRSGKCHTQMLDIAFFLW